MAQKSFESFEGTSIGSLPTGYVNVSTAAYAVTATGATAGTHAIGESTAIDGSLCRVPASVPVGGSVQYKVRTVGAVNNGHTQGIVINGSDSSATNGYVINPKGANGIFEFYKKAGASYGSNLAPTSGAATFTAVPAGSDLIIKVERPSTNVIGIKAWNASGSEPGSYNASYTDAGTAYTGSFTFLRAAKFGTYSSTPATADELYFGDVGQAFPGPMAGTVTGSGSASVGDVETFTVAFDRAYTGTMTPAVISGTAAGTPSSAQSLTAATSATFTITWTGAGTAAVGATYSDSLASVNQSVSVASVTPATATTLTLSASSGAAGLPVTLTYGANGTYAGTKAITLSDGGAGGTFGTASPNPLSSNATGTATYTPPPSPTGASITLTATLAGLTAATQGYSATADSITVTPISFLLNSVTPVTFTSAVGLYASAPSIAASGVSGASLGTITRVNSTTATANLTTGSSGGVVTFTDSTSGGATATAMIQAAGQVADWKLAGVTDLTGNGHDLAIGFPTTVPNYATVGATTGLQLGGVNFLVGDAVGFTGAAGFTLEMTVRIDSLAKTTQALMACWGRSGNQRWYWYLNAGVQSFFGSSSVSVAGATTLAVGTIYKLSAVSDGAGNLSLYVDANRDGLNAAAGNLTPSASTACPLYIGANADTTSDPRASITIVEARLSNGALYSGSTRTVPTSLTTTGATVARYDFQQPTGAFSGYMLRPGTSTTVLARGFHSGSYVDGGLANPGPPKPAPGGGYFIDFDSWDITLQMWGRWIARGSSIAGPWTSDAAPYRTPAGDEGNLTGNGYIIPFKGTYYDYYHVSTNNYNGPIYVRSSTDLTTWSARATAVGAGTQGFSDPWATLSADGTTVTLWLVQQGSRGIYSATSTDGLTFTTPAAVSSMVAYPGFTNAYGEPSPVAGGSHMLAFTDGRSGTGVGRSLWGHRSLDGGTTWHPLGQVLPVQTAGKLGAFDSAPYILASGTQLSLLHAEQDNVSPTDGTASDLVATTFNLPGYVAAAGAFRRIGLGGGFRQLAGGFGD